ncbi:rhomboid family intramembrane serine protease [Bacteroidota bacterium]
MIKLVEIIMDYDFAPYSLYPRKLSGLLGIITSPLLHSGIKHLVSNSVPVLVLGLGVFYFYNKVAYKVLLISYFAQGIWLWCFGREAYHLGASGLIYSFFSFLFLSGIIRKNINLLAISLFVAFWYGSMIWGIFPVDRPVSWEGHLMGLIAGAVLAVYYRKQGPQQKIYDWELEEKIEDEAETEEFPYWKIGINTREKAINEKTDHSNFDEGIKYHYIKKKGKDKPKNN